MIAIVFLGCNKTEQIRPLQLILIDNELKINHVKGSRINPCVTTCADINFRIENSSDENYMLYNFKRFFQFGELEDSVYCDGFRVAGKCIFVYAESNKQLLSASFLPDSIHWKPMPLEKVLNRHELSKIWFRNTKLVIRSRESLKFSYNIDFREFDLLPGIYTIKILYYQQNILNYITENQIEEDQEKFDAEMFKGCLWSNSVKLIVE
jgi:hypothetical protein